MPWTRHYDIGTNISISFIEAGLIHANSPDIDKYLKSGAWNKFVVDFFTLNGKTYGLPIMEGSKASMFYDKAMFKEAGIAAPPTTMAECVECAKKLVKFDSSDKMIRSGISLRLSGQGSGITEKFRYLLEGAGASVIVKTAAWEFMKLLANQENSLRITDMTGWVTEREDVDGKPPLAKPPQFEVFVSPPKGMDYYVEAARIDGASEWWILWRIIAPLSASAFSAIGISAFIQAWAAFIWPLLIANDQSLLNMEVGLTAFQFKFSTDYGKLIAGSVISTLPMLIVFLLLRRRIIESVALTGIKG